MEEGVKSIYSKFKGKRKDSEAVDTKPDADGNPPNPY